MGFQKLNSQTIYVKHVSKESRTDKVFQLGDHGELQGHQSLFIQILLDHTIYLHLVKNKYYVTFIDDFSRKSWVYIIKEKSEALDEFTKFKAIAEKQSGEYLKILRSDRGGEYTSNLFNDLCKDHRIIHQLTIAYMPQQNGVTQRKTRTIIDMARSMVKGKHLPRKF